MDAELTYVTNTGDGIRYKTYEGRSIKAFRLQRVAWSKGMPWPKVGERDVTPATMLLALGGRSVRVHGVASEGR